ncbi:MAG: shikimate dehydrogenase [Zoogloeaceae bacterium]|jgi:shikimate dehydrogenase|nr:shikimate dehydrogenase [Zoogloeaceae bacterium]
MIAPTTAPKTDSKTDLYAVFGNPIAHSLSPRIHTAFAAATGQALRYETRLAPREGFVEAWRVFVAQGGRGANVTVPFKEDAFRLCARPENALSERARLSGAVNTLCREGERVFGDNTDGAGLLRDLEGNLAARLAGRRVLLLGAGGAARGVLPPLRARHPACLCIANRTAEKARALAAEFSTPELPLAGCGFAELPTILNEGAFDIVLNATAASLANTTPPLPPGLFAPEALAYDMMYGKGQTPFLKAAAEIGAKTLSDGLGMLVEQAAESFLLWRGIRPETRAILEGLRALDAG